MTTEKANNNNKQDDETIDRKVNELRVAQSELVSGNTNGQVFMRLSPGAVAFVTDRSDAQDRVAAQLRKTLLQQEFPTGKKRNMP